MGGARAKVSATDRHAKRIARPIAKGNPPPVTPDLHLYFEHSPDEVFAAFEGAVRHMPPAGADNALAFGYLFLVQGLLEHLRYRAERGYEDAARLIEGFQATVVARAEAGEIGQPMLAYVAGALHQSKIPVSPEFVAVSGSQYDQDDMGGLPADVHAALAGAIEACGGNTFAFVGTLAEIGHALPAEARSALARAIALGGRSDMRSAGVLLLLDQDLLVRRAAAAALTEVGSSLAPADLRRLIAIRNWRPESERTDVDIVIRTARAAGIACAQWAAGSTETIRATAIDGVGAQAFLLASAAGRKKRISSILTKDGVKDAWSSDPQSQRRVDAVADAGLDTPALPVPRAYLDRVVSHHLTLNLDKGEVPPIGLLEVAETIGGADWQPTRTDFGSALARLNAEVPEAMRRPAAVQAALRESGELADLELVTQSWFEDDPEIERLIASGAGRDRAKLAIYLLQTVIARRRDKWTNLILRTALWLREASTDDDLCWRELAIVAKALAEGHDLTEIGLMRAIALRTIAVFVDTTPM